MVMVMVTVMVMVMVMVMVIVLVMVVVMVMVMVIVIVIIIIVVVFVGIVCSSGHHSSYVYMPSCFKVDLCFLSEEDRGHRTLMATLMARIQGSPSVHEPHACGVKPETGFCTMLVALYRISIVSRHFVRLL